MVATTIVKPSQDSKLAEVNKRLIKGQGWIGYKSSKSTTGEKVRSRFLYLKFYVNGEPKQINTGTTDPEEAYRQLIKAQKAVSDGDRLLPQEVSKLRYEHLIEFLMKDWRDRKVASLVTRKAEDGTVEETFQGKDYLDEFFRRTPVTNITATKIKNYIDWRRKQKDGDKAPSDASIRRELGILRTTFSIAKGLDLITDNHIPTFSLPEDSKPRQGYMEVQDFDKFLAAFPADLQPTVLFLYYSGCRVGAMEQITWAMVNNDCTEIHAPGSIIKNDSAWEIPLAGPLEPIAEALKTIRKQAAKEKRILASDAPVFDTTNFRKIWNQTCHDLKLGIYVTETEDGKPTQRYTGLHPHDFRRSAARNLIKAGVSERVAMKITGHKTDSMFHRYAIKNTDDVKEALIKVGEFKKGKPYRLRPGNKLRR